MMSTDRHLAAAKNGRGYFLIYAWLGTLTIFFVAVATIDLANYRPISGDDGWILSASYKLATQGVFGSDMYAGYFHADQHYFIALPGHHVLQALFLKILGPGISQARWASVISGVVLMWAACILAWRWYGPAVAVLTSAFLLFWQPALVGEGSVPLMSLSRSLRYDLPAVAWIWLALLFFDGWLRRPAPVRAFLTGFTAAAATLTQFFGSVALAIVGLGVLASGKRRALSAAGIASLLAGFFSLAGLYLFYLTLHWQDALRQTTYLKGERANLSPQALIGNLLREPRRYQHVLEQLDIAPGPWILLVGVWPALAYLGVRLRRDGRRGDRLLALTLATTFLFLALVDRTKAPIYALPLLPPLCIALARLAAESFTWAIQHRQQHRRAVGAIVLILCGLTVLHGLHFYARDRREASRVSKYQVVGSAIASEVQSEAPVAGSERWWWPLRDHDYLAVRNLALQWQTASVQDDEMASFASLLQENDIRYIVVDVIVRTDIGVDSQLLREQFESFLERCTAVQEEWSDPTYGQISLFVVRPACRS